MLQQDGIGDGQKQDLEYVLGALNELLAQVKALAAKVPDEDPGRRVSVGSGHLCLEETTEQFLMTFTKQRTHLSFREVAQSVRFALRASKRAKASGMRAVEFDLPVQRLVDKINSWNEFDAFRMAQVTNNQPLKHVAIAVLQQRGLLTCFSFPSAPLQKFLAEMEHSYLDNPYHNSLHAADVLQAMHLLLIGTKFSDIEIFAGIFAAMCHDAGHPGVTNDFRIQSGDDCAITYNDKSVNENMHCALTYRLLKRDDCNFLSAISTDQRKLIRRLTVELILSTDMAVHFSELQKFQSNLQTSGPDILKWDHSDKALGLALHAADLSNVCRPFRLSRRWSELILSEYFLQGDTERTLGRSISPLCDRESVSIPDSQIGFIDFIVKPLYEAVAQCYNAEPALQNMGETSMMWIEERKKAAGRKASRTSSGSAGGRVSGRSASGRPSGNSTSLQMSSPR